MFKRKKKSTIATKHYLFALYLIIHNLLYISQHLFLRSQKIQVEVRCDFEAVQKIKFIMIMHERILYNYVNLYVELKC